MNERSQKSNTFFGGAAILAASIIVVKIIGALYKIPLGRILGDVGFGHFNNAYAIFNLLLMVSTAGLPVAMSKTISEANALGRRNQVNRVFRVALATFLVLGAVSASIMFFFAEPLAVLQGCALAVEEYGVDILVTGDETVLRKTAEENGVSLNGIEIVHAPGVITMENDPTSILKEKADCSMAAAFNLVKEGEGDAFVSGGSTGAIVVGATFLLKRIKGVKRAGLATVIPTINGCYLLMDAGANIECRPEVLCQFGVMGSLYMQKVQKVESPRVGLVNIGSEETKGGETQIEALKLLKSAPIRFTGNVEAREIPAGAVDVAVADGFTGNVILKLTEGLGSMFSKKIKGMFTGVSGKLAGVLMLPKVKAFKKSMDYTEYGGAPLLGITSPVIKAHGSSNAKAIKNAIRQARDFTQSGLTGEIQQAVQAMKPAASAE